MSVCVLCSKHSGLGWTLPPSSQVLKDEQNELNFSWDKAVENGDTPGGVILRALRGTYACSPLY